MGNIRKAHLLFEQSGTFKKEFIKLGIPAEDYDIQNDFGETEHVVDLYAEIESAYLKNQSIFDDMTPEDVVFSFFPCTRFEDQILLSFRGEQNQDKKMTDEEKLERDIVLHKQLSRNYELITKLAIVCIRRKLKLIVENPYSSQHYLTRYWCIKPKVIDTDRTERGDYFTKPTQFWFIGTEPKNNIILEMQNYNAIGSAWGSFDRSKFVTKNITTIWSMIHPDYANRFIREHIL